VSPEFQVTNSTHNAAGYAVAAVTGAAGGAIGGALETPFKFLDRVPLGAVQAAAANATPGAIARGIAGDAVSSYDPS
jgi:hypothetical protein